MRGTVERRPNAVLYFCGFNGFRRAALVDGRFVSRSSNSFRRSKLFIDRYGEHTPNYAERELEVQVYRKSSNIPESIPYGSSNREIYGFQFNSKPQSVGGMDLQGIHTTLTVRKAPETFRSPTTIPRSSGGLSSRRADTKARPRACESRICPTFFV